MGQIDFEGAIQMGHNVKIGYFAQNERRGSHDDHHLQTIDDTPGYHLTRIRDISALSCSGKYKEGKLVKVLSGGERTNLA